MHPTEVGKEMEEAHQLHIWEGYVDWRNKPALRGRHGGMLAASFVLVVEILENLAYLANASNLVLYMSKFMHFSPSRAANMVTNFMGTAFLLALLGAFLADAFFTTYRIYLISAAIEFTVLTAAVYNTCSAWIARNTVMSKSPAYTAETREGEDSEAKEKVPNHSLTESLKFLDRAANNEHKHSMLKCTERQVEEVKIVLRILPIFMSTMMLNCCLAQLSTFSVQQAATMNTMIGSLKVPPASLPVFPVIFIIILAPVYSHVILPFARKITKTEMGITHLQRIGTGLVLSMVGMVVAALVEMKRKKVATDSELLNSEEPLPITFLWVALQYLFLGSADLFTLAGTMEFFFTEAPSSMRSLATALSWASLAMGYYLSSVLVSIVNDVTGAYRHRPWLLGSNLNYYHLERFYWLMCVLSGLNFLHYLFWANRYKYRSMEPNQ
ncbi:hypothetical protein I3843_12G016600 [Carya illinoinensis]|nr:hypothetical protein I3843_12G016600 [Carya illinoinensis]